MSPPLVKPKWLYKLGKGVVLGQGEGISDNNFNTTNKSLTYTALWGYRASIHFFSLYCLFVSPQRLLGLFLQVPDHPEHDPYFPITFIIIKVLIHVWRRRRSVAAWFHKPILLKPYPIQIVPSSNCTLLKLNPPPFAASLRILDWVPFRYAAELVFESRLWSSQLVWRRCTK